MTEQPKRHEGGWETISPRELEPSELAPEPIRVDHVFKSGTHLLVDQDENNKPHIRFARDGKTVLDMEEYLPPGYSLIHAPHQEQRIAATKWYIDHAAQQINVGAFDDVRSLFALLHEIGHARDPEPIHVHAEAKKVATETILNSDSSSDRQSAARELMRAVAARERGPSAYAVKTLREIAGRADFDTKELFPTYKEFKDYIHEKLETYRDNIELTISKRAFPDTQEFLRFSEELWNAFHGAGPGKSNP